MGLKCGVGLAFGAILLVFVFMPSDSLAAARVIKRTEHWGWHSSFGFNRTAWALRNSTKIVGGSEHWRYGFNYNNWALQNCPFYQNDTLIFKYDPPSNNTFPHNVYLFKNFWSYSRCDFNQSTLVANPMQGGGDGFKFVLTETKPYYFGCSEHGGDHCNAGMMRFVVWPLKPPHKRANPVQKTPARKLTFQEKPPTHL